MNKIFLSKLNFWHILKSNIKPVRATKRSAIVDISFGPILNILDIIITLITLITIVIPPGNDFFQAFIKKLPSNLFLFGSRARTSDGAPIVMKFIKLKCIG